MCPKVFWGLAEKTIERNRVLKFHCLIYLSFASPPKNREIKLERFSASREIKSIYFRDEQNEETDKYLCEKHIHQIIHHFDFFSVICKPKNEEDVLLL